jgi:cupin superfamily acireductone dioxygenase involved in methionine salvage
MEMINSKNINENEFQNEVIIKGYNKPISKEWEANYCNENHMHDTDLFLFVQKGKMVISVEHEKGENTMAIGSNESIEVLAGTRHYESVGPEGVVFLVACRDTN